MNKREYCESRESVAYYSGLNGLEIKGIEYGINDFVYCVSGCWYGGKAAPQFPRQAVIKSCSRKNSILWKYRKIKPIGFSGRVLRGRWNNGK